MTTEVTDLFKDLDVSGTLQKVGDTPLGLPLHAHPDRTNAELRTKMDLISLLSQKKQHGVYTITSASAANSHVFTIAASQDYIQNHLGSATDTASRYFSSYSFKKIKVYVEVVSMLQQQGALVVVNSNMPSVYYNLLPNLGHPADYCKLPRKFIPFGAQTTHVFEIPWNCALSHIPLYPKYPEHFHNPDGVLHDPFYDHGRLVCRVFDSLRVADGVTNFVTVRVWTEIEGLDLATYSPSSLL